MTDRTKTAVERPGRVASLVLLLCAGLMVQACASSSARSPARDDHARDRLRRDITEILARPALARMSIGVKVTSLASGETLFARDAGRLFHPASNTKLFTAVSALKTLGPASRFTTAVYTDAGAFVRHDTLSSPVYLRGGGDPLLKTADLDTLADRIARYGIRTIDGDLIVDDTLFDDRRLGAGWMWDDVEYGYSAQISALTVNANCVTVVVSPGGAVGDRVSVRLEPPTAYVEVRTDAVTGPPVPAAPARPDSTAGASGADAVSSESTPLRVERHWRTHRNVIAVTGRMPLGAAQRRFVRTVEAPAAYAGTLFRERLAARGVNVTGEIRQAAVPATAPVLTVHHSEPLPVALRFMLKTSDNLTAELLIKQIGLSRSGSEGATDHGLHIARRALIRTAALDTLQYVWADGSGLSWYNLFTPAQVVALLTAVYEDAALHDPVINALPVAGVDGTLENRMQRSAAWRNLRAKTGTLSGVSCLSGFVRSRDGEPLVFSIMMNHYAGSSSAARRAQNEIGVLLARFTRRGRPNLSLLSTEPFPP